jgi:uncharacterized protein (DUF433 family)
MKTANYFAAEPVKPYVYRTNSALKETTYSSSEWATAYCSSVRRKLGTHSSPAWATAQAHGYTLFMESSTGERIVKTLGICGGRARIAGHRVRVLDIVTWQEHEGLTPDEIVSNVPSITLAEVHAALAYYFDHLEEIKAEMREERTLVDEARRNHSSLVDAKRAEDHREAS